MTKRRATFVWLSCAVAALGWSAAVRAVPVPADSVQSASIATSLESAVRAIDELRLADAEQILAELDQDKASTLFERARLAFHRGAYADAVALVDRALVDAKGRERTRYQNVRDLFASTHEVTRGFTHERSPDGRYEVSYPPGKDALIARYALAVLAAADQALSVLLDTGLEPPLRLEIYASPDDFARVSSLTVEQIETTGTVALSKWNRLMITSPKALVRGYPWADTITHELVHLLLSRKSADKAPVWLQEGTAKLLERSWRKQDSDLFLDAGARALLHTRNAKGKLLTFEQMHPSIAMLPSEDDAALAFAQVATFMQRYVADHGQVALRDALSRIAGGTDAREALAAAASTSFAKLEASWKASLPRATEAEEVRRLVTRFRKGDGAQDESAEVEEEGARKHMRIGDLLWDRGRKRGAAREYEKAYRQDPLDPIVTARWARAALQVDQTQSVVEVLTPHVQRHPGHAPAQALLGRAQLLLGDHAAARASLREAIWINPFDPDPHCDLVQASDDEREREAERSACESLR
jgi:tetratricopeptide (TPR) repeat protein